ncbi:MAG TPA: PLDc N-terminal domain-containing protein [Candidatus Eisenbacteria bacterium]|nr:PLDc N-terminal domain-containing protein [Candidatus Eisenbacteria bacterium]
MWIFVWLLVAWRVIRRPDIGPLAKVLWIVIILVIPLLGLFVYFLWDAMRTKPA